MRNSPVLTLVVMAVGGCGQESQPVDARTASRATTTDARTATIDPSAALDPGDGPDDGAPTSTSFGDPIPGLSAHEQARFEAGKAEFLNPETAADGLGPVFNGESCSKCHDSPAAGGSSSTNETRFGKVSSGAFDPLSSRGGALVQTNGIGVFPDPAGGPDCNYVGEVVPPEADVTGGRHTTPLFGLGLVDATPTSKFQAIASREALFFPDEAGRFGAGPFGWKAQQTSLHAFAGDAYLNEMGITNPEFPDENCPQGDCSLLRCNPVPGLNDDGTDVNLSTDFMRFLAPPPRGSTSAIVIAGRVLFDIVGCNHCHTPTIVSGANASPALSNQPYHPYSDLLLHRMGSLADGIEVNGTHGDEFRTAPLWGAHARSSFLHDGRAGTVSDAIQAHDGQGHAARDRFDALPAPARKAILDFIDSL